MVMDIIVLLKSKLKSKSTNIDKRNLKLKNFTYKPYVYLSTRTQSVHYKLPMSAPNTKGRVHQVFAPRCIIYMLYVYSEQ